jgi:hypothetical protein
MPKTKLIINVTTAEGEPPNRDAIPISIIVSSKKCLSLAEVVKETKENPRETTEGKPPTPKKPIIRLEGANPPTQELSRPTTKTKKNTHVISANTKEKENIKNRGFVPMD